MELHEYLLNSLERASLSVNGQPERRGQAYFNELVTCRPDLSERVRGCFTFDPFYNDTFVDRFVEWVCEHWDENPSIISHAGNYFSYKNCGCPTCNIEREAEAPR